MVGLYIGIGLVVIGWLTLAYFAAKQISAEKNYALQPHKWDEVRHSFITKRWMCRGIVILGILVIVISTLI